MSLLQQCRRLLVSAIVAVGLAPVGSPVQSQSVPYCQQLPPAIQQKETLLKKVLTGDRAAQRQYQALLKRHAAQLQACRQRNYPRTEAIWIRLYPCDVRPGVLEGVLDRIVNRGYNQVNLEVFGGGKVLLPANRNPTPWPSLLAGTRAANTDLLADAIRKARQRGLRVYAWLFTLNVGASYLQRSDRQQSIARNGLGQDSLTAGSFSELSMQLGYGSPDEAFADPYSPQTRQDYRRLMQAIVQRKPDGILLDYIRYPRGSQGNSVTSKVQDLWVYGNASREILLRRALNYKGLELILRYLNRGFITAEDLKEVQQQYPNEAEPLWQGRKPSSTANLGIDRRVAVLQSELWQLTLSHAFQGVLEFLEQAAQPAQAARLPVGVVFFPEGNQAIGQGYDSRLQFWQYFPRTLEWHPMLYGVCGQPNCIVAQMQRVLSLTPPGTQVKPVLAGIWQEPVSNRPPLEVQMRELYRTAPKLLTISHFAYSWQEPGSDRDRKACKP
jgi:hypothetical protein